MIFGTLKKGIVVTQFKGDVTVKMGSLPTFS